MHRICIEFYIESENAMIVVPFEMSSYYIESKNEINGCVPLEISELILVSGRPES